MFKYLLCSLLLIGSLEAAEIETGKAECPVAKGKKVNPAQSVSYEGGKVFFCCGKCKAAFEKDSSKFAAKANHQLVVTKQATQIACPFSAQDVNPAKTVTVNNAEVGFCCGNCQGKVAAMETADQINAVFSPEAFKKGFEVKTK